MAGLAWYAPRIALVSLLAGAASAQPVQTPLRGGTIPKFVDPLPTFVGRRVSGPQVGATMMEMRQRVLPDAIYGSLARPHRDGTQVWGYRVSGTDATTGAPVVVGPTYPGVTVEAQRHVPTTVLYTNALTTPKLQRLLPVDQTIGWADPAGLGCELQASMSMACLRQYAGPVPMVVHLHGSEVPPAFDGGPDQWFTSTGLHGSNYGSLSTVGEGQALYRYPNDQEAATLWFHDHSLGTTRLNVYGGVAAFYLLRDHQDTGRGDNPLALPAGAQEVELVIQDRSFDTDGELLYFDATQLASPDVHPYWRPEFFGDVIVVNGKSWPKMEVEPRRYRLRILNGSNARFYQMALARRWMPMVDRTTTPQVAAGIRVTERGPTFWQIGTDGGRLDQPVAMETILLAPGERADVIVDFSSAAGESLTLVNDANAPYPGGDPVDPQTTAQIMRFDVARRASAADGTCEPAAPASRAGACRLRPGNPIVRLVDPAAGALAAGVQPDERRQLILREIEGPTGPLEVLVNNTSWEGLKESSLTRWPVPVDGSIGIGAGFVTEAPRVGATELWEVANLTEDAHPIHMHLVQFQVVNRQSIDTGRDDKDAPIGYLKDLLGALPPSADPGKEPPADGPPFTYTSRNGDGAVGGNAAFSGYLAGDVSAPAPNEAGWKDTVVMYPATVTRIAVRFAPQAAPLEAARPGVNLFPFDPTLTDPARRDLFGNPGSAGSVWHCHILEHEDNDMMRPYAVRP